MLKFIAALVLGRKRLLRNNHLHRLACGGLLTPPVAVVIKSKVSRSEMPLDVKKAIASLILSFVAMLLVDYIDSLYIEGYDFFSLFMLGINLVWLVVIVWIVSDILQKKNVVPTLYGVSAVMLCFLVVEFIEAGFVQSQIFVILEIVFLLLPVHFLKSESAKLWLAGKNP